MDVTVNLIERSDVGMLGTERRCMQGCYLTDGSTQLLVSPALHQ